MKKIAAFVLALVLAFGCPVVCLALGSANSGGGGVNASSQQSAVPERPVPTGMLAYWDEAEALIAAAPVTVEEVDSVLAPFGLNCSNLSEITNGVFTQADIEHGRVDAEYWAQLGEIFSVQKEAYAYELLAYERQLEKASEENRFEVPPGIYTVGEDFPAGVFTIKNAEGSSLFNISVYDADGSSVFSDGFWADEGEYLGKIELLDGYTVEIDQGVALFAPYIGLQTVGAFE